MNYDTGSAAQVAVRAIKPHLAKPAETPLAHRPHAFEAMLDAGQVLAVAIESLPIGTVVQVGDAKSAAFYRHGEATWDCVGAVPALKVSPPPARTSSSALAQMLIQGEIRIGVHGAAL